MELTATIFFSILFIFLNLMLSQNSLGNQDSMSIFIDLSLLPWLIWIAKKIIDIVKAYKLRIAECETKYEERIKDLIEREASLRLQFRSIGDNFEIHH